MLTHLLPAIDIIFKQQTTLLLGTRLGLAEADMEWARPLIDKAWPEIVDDTMRRVRGKVEQALRREGAAVYAHLSPGEQKALLDFYRSELGRKAIAADLEYRSRIETFFGPGGVLYQALRMDVDKLERWLRAVLNRPSNS
ncbi:MAG: DUF2059 domain-containing protein [Candidatus Protistobacter heckmanni]|nr:DUF2059 domain-containing protein [Candidatus Protistobacter heckmanni]